MFTVQFCDKTGEHACFAAIFYLLPLKTQIAGHMSEESKNEHDPCSVIR